MRVYPNCGILPVLTSLLRQHEISPSLVSPSPVSLSLPPRLVSPSFLCRLLPSIEWVLNLPTDTIAATTKWGDIGDWDVSGVKDFSFAFYKHRNVGGSYAYNGNLKAATFVGTTISKWNTASATTLSNTFYGASVMNADLTGWKVGKVVTLQSTFASASKFTGTGLWSWDVAKVTTMSSTFYSTSLTTCNKRKIADAWKSSAVFVATTYDTDWAADTCTVRFE